MQVFLDLNATDLRVTKFSEQGFEVFNKDFGNGLSTSFEGFDRLVA
jgi:hypothetical protein